MRVYLYVYIWVADFIARLRNYYFSPLRVSSAVTCDLCGDQSLARVRVYDSFMAFFANRNNI